MPTLDEIRRQAWQQGGGQKGVNQEIAKAVTSGEITTGPELTDEEVARKWEPAAPELTDEEVAERMTPTPEEQFGGIVKRMAENYQKSPQYKELLERELTQISAQIAELTQRRNMIEMAMRGKA